MSRSSAAVLRDAMAHVRRGALAEAIALLAPHEQDGGADLLGLLGQLRLQTGDLDGALDVLVPGFSRAEQVEAHRDMALLGLALTQVLVAVGRGLAGVRVLGKARVAAETCGNAALVAACTTLADSLAEQVPPGRDAASTRVVAAHFSGLLARAAGDLARSRTHLRLAWALAGEGVSPAIQAELGVDLMQRQVADGDPAWRATARAARAAAVAAQDTDLVAELDRLVPQTEEEPLAGEPQERARQLAERGEVERAVAVLRQTLVAGGGDEIGVRVQLSEMLVHTDPDRAVSVLAPSWGQIEREGDAAATVAVALPHARAMAASGQHQDAVRVLLVADRRAESDPAQRVPVQALGRELRGWLPEVDALPADDAEARAVVAGTRALLAVLAGDPDASHQLRAAWALAPAAGDRAIAQIGFDLASLGRALGLSEWAAVRDEARAAAERSGDAALAMVLDAIGPPRADHAEQ